MRSDEKSAEILKSCRQALNPGGKVVLAEAVLPPAGKDTMLKPVQLNLDVLMMTIGGKERTELQWQAVATAAGFKIAGVTETPSPLCQLVELEVCA